MDKTLRPAAALLVILSVLSAQAQAQTSQKVLGDIRDAHTNAPIEGVAVIAYMEDTPGIKCEAVSDANGRFTITGLQPGRVVFELTRDGYRPDRVRKQIPSTQPSHSFTFELEAVVRQAGTVTPEIKERYDRANRLFKEQKLDEARAIFEELIEEYPDLYQIRINLGIIYQAKRELDKALEHFLQVYRQAPENGDLMIYIADTYLAKEDFRAALDWYRRGAEAKPDFYWVANQAADVARYLQEYDVAIEYYRKAVRIDASQPLPHLQLGTLLEVEGDYPGALEHLLKSIELDDRKQALEEATGLIEETIAKYDGAESFFKTQAASPAPQPLIYYYLGSIQAGTTSAGAEAIANLKRYLELDPDDDFALGEKARDLINALQGG